MMNPFLEKIIKNLLPLNLKLMNSELYKEIASVSNLCFFMEQHVFAVWDFMCLLKELHRRIVSTSAPWFPPKDALSAHLINSILSEEESDLTLDGKTYASHYEIYISAMENLGANTCSIKQFLSLLSDGVDVSEAMHLIHLRTGTKRFVSTTFSFFNCELHELMSVFVFGREGITSKIFSSLINALKKKVDIEKEVAFNHLIYYLKRHVDLDGNEHFPKALEMLSNFIGYDTKKWKEAEMAARKALTARIDFLSDIEAGLHQTKRAKLCPFTPPKNSDVALSPVTG